MEKRFFFEWNGTFLQLRKSDGERWALFCNSEEVCSYSSPERAALFVSQGFTGHSIIDRMSRRPRGIHEWHTR